MATSDKISRLFHGHAVRGWSRGVAFAVTLNVLMYIAVWATAGFHGTAGVPDSLFAQLLPLSGSWSDTLTRPWTLLTYMVTQFSVLHLIFNVLLLAAFGTLCVRLDGTRTMFLLYAAGGILGGVFFCTLNTLVPSPGSYLVGASASVMALMLYATVREPGMRVRLWPFGNVRLIWIAVVCFILAVLNPGGTNLGGVAAHVGGALAGALWAVAARIAARRRRENDLMEKRIAADPQGRLDELLDKIRVSGFSSLSSREKTELNRLSGKL